MNPRKKLSQTHNALVATLAVAILAAGAPALAGAQSSVAYINNPVKVVRYVVTAPTANQWPGWGGTYQGIEDSASVTISFVNGANVAATSVQFAVRHGKETELIVDKGTFSPGTSITHDFSLGPQFDGASSVEVREVTFADGTSWQQG
jgi:hypothetical protein